MASFKLFGRIEERPVYLIKLTNGNIEAEFINFGATLRCLRVPDKNGIHRDVCLGYDSVEEYLSNDGYLGASIGRNANRISNSSFTIKGKEYKLSSNEGSNQLHGGLCGFSHKFWDFSCTENSVTFTIDSPDGDEGYPGALHAEVCYSINDCSLRIDYRAVSDTDTIVNLTNHSYFNLSGHNSGDIKSHTLKIGSESYTPCGKGNIPSGDIKPIKNTFLDFACEKELGKCLSCLSGTPTEGLDHNFVLNAAPAAVLYSPESGIEMCCKTSLEGIQVYSAGFLTERKGKNGAIYSKHHGICLETQHFPDAINNPAFPSPVLEKGKTYSEWTEYSFTIR